MITVSSIVYGVLATIVGLLLLMYTFPIVNFTGRQDWIERYLGSGSTYLAYKIFGVILVLGGVMGALGLLHGILTTLLSPLRSLFPQR